MTSLPGTSGRRRIYLLRHGAVEYLNSDGTRVENARNVALTAAGREQAEQLAELLANVALDRVVHSDLPRTRETAEIVLGDGRALTPEAAPELREIHIGDIDGITSERMRTEFAYGFEAASDPRASFPGGEPFGEFFERVVAGLEHLLRQPGWTRMLLVAHGGTNRVILSWMARAGPDSIASFEQDEGCLNILDVDVVNGEAVRRYVRAMNLTPYSSIKEGLHLTTMERIVADVLRRRG